MKKRLLISMLLIIAVLSNILFVGASASNSFFDDGDLWQAYLMDSRSNVTYEFFDSEGKDITEIISQSSKKADAAFDPKTTTIVRTTIEKTSRSAQINMGVTKEYDAPCSPISGNPSQYPTIDFNGRVKYQVYGYITYDPVTLKISYASTPVRTTLTWSGWHSHVRPYTYNEGASSYLTGNNYYAVFDYTLFVKADYMATGTVIWDTFNYGNHSYSFTVYPD